LDKEKFMNWLEKKVNEVPDFKPKDELNKSYILGDATAMYEVVKQVEEGKFDIE
jgi:hypothetical protein